MEVLTTGAFEWLRAGRSGAYAAHATRLVGPAVAGICIAQIGAASAFYLNALSFVALMVALATLPKRPPGTVEEEEARLGGFKEGFAYVRGDLPTLGMIGLIVIPIGLWIDLKYHARSRDALIDLWLLAYLIGFIAFHWLLAFQIWDRYFLLIVPIAALLMGRLVTRIIDSFKDHLVILSALHLVTLSLVMILCLPYAFAASKSQYAIGGDHGASDGIDQVASYLAALPSGTVVYDHWLAWELSYYLGEGHVYLAYFDTPGALAGDLQAFAAGGEDRYVVFPARESPDKTIEAIGPIGFQMTPVYSTINRFNQTSFTIFKIIPSTH